VTKKGSKAQPAEGAAAEDPKKLSNHAQRSLDERKKGACIARSFHRIFTEKHPYQTLKSTLSLRVNLVLVVSMHPSHPDLANLAAQMVTSWRARSLRYVDSAFLGAMILSVEYSSTSVRSGQESRSTHTVLKYFRLFDGCAGWYIGISLFRVCYNKSMLCQACLYLLRTNHMKTTCETENGLVLESGSFESVTYVCVTRDLRDSHS
jgi:hypothetical protein